ncbi:unnamed protein product [Mytilus coruscus]|uniref:Uncharacterized protein n=1 Tax=Mytilus coruscus TaxID=42192 RepID=A0A6J8EWN6_MYTCO|nr:unnamed protein product [Mytilus coruscus]
MSLVNINTCSFQELLQLPGIGINTGEQIMDIRDGKGFVTEADLATLSHLRVTMALIARLDFSTNGGGQNIGPPPEARGKHQSMINTIIDGGMVASPGMPCQTHGQSVFKQEGWHQGQSPGAWGGLSQLDSAFLEYSSYHEEARSRPETPANWSGVYGEQLLQKEWGHHNAGDPDQGNNPHPGGSSSIGHYKPCGQAKTVLGKRVPNLKGAHHLIPGVTPWFTQTIIQVRGHHLAPNWRTQVGGSMRHPIVGMASGKTIGARTQGRPQPTPMEIGKTIGTRTQGRPQPAPMEIGKTIGARTQGRPQPVPMEIGNPRGIENKELGVQVANLQPQSIEEAADKIRLFQHMTQAIYGKPIRCEGRQVMSGWYEDHPEAYHEYQVPHERATMAPERAPASAWKA